MENKQNNSILADIFYKHTKIDFKKHIELADVGFFSPTLKIPVRELVLILLEVQEKFNMKITEEALINKEFSTFNKVSKLIERR